jgi:hypothetical protein
MFARLVRSDTSWVCSSCKQTATQQAIQSPIRQSARKISNSSKSRQNVAPTMEQLREPFKRKNLSTLYIPPPSLCCISLIVFQILHNKRCPRNGCILIWIRTNVQDGQSILNPTILHIPKLTLLSDLPNHRLGRPTHQIRRPLHLGPLDPPPTRHLREAHPHNLQRFRLRRPALDIHTSAARSARPAGRDRIGVLHGDE